MFVTAMNLFLFLVLAPTAQASTKWYVDGVNGSDNNNCKSRQHACKTIGHTISLASSGDSIMVAAATYKENLSIGFNLTVIGFRAATTIINGGGVNTAVTIPNSSAHVTLSKVTIRNGYAHDGGGIFNLGALTINNCIVTGNSGAGFGSSGGGISSTGRLTINNSTISRNGATAGSGIAGGGTTTINHSTISRNVAGRYGGGIAGVTLSVNNSTVSDNKVIVNGRGGGIFIYSRGTLTVNNSTLSGNGATYGGGIFSDSNGTATLQNSIVANSPSGGNCYGTMTSQGYNVSSDNTCNFNGTGDLNNTDPKLGPLQDNGGPTQTHGLLSGSPAIDSGNPNGCTDGNGRLLKTDQRGKPRPDKEDSGGCDMGAYERQKD
jgi:hypothetical protein